MRGFGGVDIDSCGRHGRRWRAVNKPLGVGDVCGIKNLGAFCKPLRDASVVDIAWGEKTERLMVMLIVVPIEEAAEERLSMFERHKSVRKARGILERLELRF